MPRIQRVSLTTRSGKDTVVVILPDTVVLWDGSKIGYVWKGSRTYSPPIYPGSRIVKYHKEVPEWHGSRNSSTRADIRKDTRREVIARLIELEEERRELRG